MNKLLVNGYEKIENNFGYWPSFHDDIVEKIEISSDEITFFIKMQTFPKSMNSSPVIKLMFCEVDKFNLEGEPYGCASIIFDMETQEGDNYIETQISSSLGANGTIRSKTIKIEFA
jgi:hypothetical protein